jgi:hypothetical protein
MFKDKKQKEKQQSATLAQQLNRAFFFSSAGELSGHLEPGHPGVQSHGGLTPLLVQLWWGEYLRSINPL